jgi:diketogulonate reductase-like aldo/keto reductase
MGHHVFGPTDRLVPIIGQGTWYNDRYDRGSAIAALRRGLDLGLTHIDTSEMYGSGAAEEMVTEAIGGRRKEVFLVSQVLPHHATRQGTIEACEGSLTRLNTEWLDCYLLHWRRPHPPLGDTIAAFAQLVREGKILSWGVSNFDVPDLEEVEYIAGPGRLACNQALYRLQERAIEHAVIPWCEKHGVAVVGYSPFGRGHFPGSRTDGGRVLQEIATTHHATPRQVALRFLVRRPSLFTIPRATHSEHATENARAGELLLSEAELARIDEAFPLGPHPQVLPML